MLGARARRAGGRAASRDAAQAGAYRAAPEDPWAAIHHVHHVHEQRGPYAALERLGRLATEGLEPDLQADMRLRGPCCSPTCATSPRPSTSSRAPNSTSRDRPGFWTIRSAVLAEDDRLEEALEAAQVGAGRARLCTPSPGARVGRRFAEKRARTPRRPWHASPRRRRGSSPAPLASS